MLELVQGEAGIIPASEEFIQTIKQLCEQHNILLIVDEVQTGIGITGKWWAHDHYSINPDIITFGKKTQVCGLLAGKNRKTIQSGLQF